MVVTDCMFNWYAVGSPKSVVLIKCNFDEDLWDQIWPRIKTFLNSDKPAATHWMKKFAVEFRYPFNDYIQENTELIGEVPRVTTEEKQICISAPIQI